MIEPPNVIPKSVAISQAKREQRLAQYQQVVALREQGFSQTAIAGQVGISHATVSRWLSHTTPWPSRSVMRHGGASWSGSGYYGQLHAIPIVAVAPQFTSQQCSGCGKLVNKSLSERTHRCVHCGLVMDRDENAARNILVKALQWLNEQGCTEGHSETGLPARRRNASGQKTTTASQP